MADPLGVFANTADGVLAVDSKGHIVLWNEAAEKILGYTPREVLGNACCETIEGRDPSGNRLCHTGCHVLAMVKSGERVQNYDIESRTKAGQSIWLNVSILAVPGSRPGLEVTVHLFRDVTYLYRLRELIRERGALPAVPGSNGDTPDLTRRELQILRLVAEGLRTEGVAQKLSISEATVRNHVQNILTKLEVHSRLEAVSLAMKHRLL